MYFSAFFLPCAIHFPNYYSNFKGVRNFKSTTVSLNFPLSFIFKQKTTGKSALFRIANHCREKLILARQISFKILPRGLQFGALLLQQTSFTWIAVQINFLQPLLTHYDYHVLNASLPPVGYSTKFYTGRLPFWQKTYPFRIPSIYKWYPFHIPILELCTSFNRCKCTVFNIWLNHKTRTFSQLFNSHKMHLLVLRTFYTPQWEISLPFHTLQQVNSLLFCIPEAW